MTTERKAMYAYLPSVFAYPTNVIEFCPPADTVFEDNGHLTNWFKTFRPGLNHSYSEDDNFESILFLVVWNEFRSEDNFQRGILFKRSWISYQQKIIYKSSE